MSRAWLF